MEAGERSGRTKLSGLCRVQIRSLTSTDDFALDQPFTENGKEKCHGVHDGYCETQLCRCSTCVSMWSDNLSACAVCVRFPNKTRPVTYFRGICTQAMSRGQKEKERRVRRRTGLTNKQKEPHTAREVQQQRHRVPWVPQQVNDREERSVKLRSQPARLD